MWYEPEVVEDGRRTRQPRRRARRAVLVLALAFTVLSLVPATGSAAVRKAIWGPSSPTTFQSDYCPLGVGFYQLALDWRDIAPTRPLLPDNPLDPAYNWPNLSSTIAAANACGVKLSLLLIWTPAWANGGQARNVPPSSNADFANFAKAVARRYPSVRHFQIWGEPTRRGNWSLTERTRRLRLTKKQRRSPRRYASLLHAAYRALNQVNRRNVVIGGMTLTRGDILPLAWIRAMRRPNGRRPRFDMYGHNPFTARRPRLKGRVLQRGAYDFSDLDTLAKAIDRYLVPKRKVRRGGRVVRRPKRRPKIWISEWTVPSDITTPEFLGFYVTRETQAKWLASALRIARRWKRLYTVGWFTLYDASAAELEGPVGWGLRTSGRSRKPSWYAYRNN